MLNVKKGDGTWKNYRKREKIRKMKGQKESTSLNEDNEKETKYVSVLFAPHTEFSALAKRWRAKLEVLEKVSAQN